MATKKKAVAKKAAPKKAAVKKPVTKKATVRKVAKKAAVKKAPAKKAAKKAPVKRTVSKSPVAVVSKLAPVQSPVETVIEVTPIFTPTAEAAAPKKKKSSGIFWSVAAGVLVIAAVMGFSGNKSETTEEAATPTASTSPSPVKTSDPVTVQESGVTDVRSEYSPIGGAILWTEPEVTDTVSEYQIQASFGDGPFETIATVEVGTTSFDLLKTDTPGRTYFRIATIYPSKKIVSGSTELKGQYAPQG
jgi:DNA-binding protein HU-beta